MKLVLIPLLLLSAYTCCCQVVIKNASVYIQPGCIVVVEGNFTSNEKILGGGTVQLVGTANQVLNMGSDTIANLVVNNADNITLASTTYVSTSLAFVNGKIQAGNYDLVLLPAAKATGYSANAFVQTNGTGTLVKQTTTPLAGFVLPVGETNNYLPLSITFTGTGSNMVTVAARAVTGPAPQINARAQDYFNNYWVYSQSGVTYNTGGTATVVGGYTNTAAQYHGNLANINGVVWEPGDWALNSTTINTTANTITYNNVYDGGGQELVAMDRFVMVSAKAYLQGAYFATGTTGLMNDFLRGSGVGYGNVIPLTDPYRTAPYNANFTHVNNPVVETVAPAVFNTNYYASGSNIVDWVFLELRNTHASPGNTVLATRSALLQADGNIVDVDGVSPVFFQNIPAGNYTIAVRHRNHLGIAANAANFYKALNVQTPVAANTFDFTTATSDQIYGGAPAYVVMYGGVNGNTPINALWGGNANGDGKVAYSGPGNDAAYILGSVLGGNPNSQFTGYSPGDLLLDGYVYYDGQFGDVSTFLLPWVLNNDPDLIRMQYLPK